MVKAKKVDEAVRLTLVSGHTHTLRFYRDGKKSWEDVKFGSHYKGGKKRFAFFENNSYLSKAGNSADSPQIIRSVYNYFRRNIFHLGSEERVHILDWKDNPEIVEAISTILCKVDTGISGIEFEDNKNLDNLKHFS